jgi:flagellar biosynthetic protein FlhB
MAEDSGQDKDLPASGKRRQQARDKGQVSRSRDLTSSVLLLGGALGLVYGGGWIYHRSSDMLTLGLTIPAAAARDPLQTLAFAGRIGEYGLALLLPILALAFVVSLAGSLAVGGWVFSLDVFVPDFTRLDPVAGLARMFSTHGLGELVKAMLKALVIGGIAGMVLWSRRGALMQLLQVDPGQVEPLLAALCAKAFLWIAAATVLIGGLDVPWQIYQLNKKLKMSVQDMKDEARESDGNPQVKQRMRALQRERSRRRMMAAVPKADVVVTNPTHYAVALAYTEGENRAPVVLALGTDHLAARIREIAREHGVPIVEAPPLARALYRYADLDREIPATLYNAVALLLAYVYQLRMLPQQAELPRDWAIPSDLDTSADTAMPVH